MVLFALGLAPATREALPFGAGLVLIGAVAGVIGAVRLATGLRSGEAAGAAAIGAHAVRPPTTVSCPRCGGSAPVQVARPSHSSCPFCRVEFPLTAEIATLLQRAGALLNQQAQSERQIARSIAALAARQRGWVIRVLLVAAALCAIAFVCAVYGFAIRTESNDWYAWLGFGVSSLLATGVLTLLAVSIVPAWMRRILGRYSALQLPGVQGLACRECGAPLPATGAPVLRCSYCAADNVAGRDVLSRLAAGASSASRSALAVAERGQVGDEIAAAGFIAFPLLVLLAWFAAGAAAGSALVTLAHGAELDPDDDQRYAVVRVEPGRACVAAMRRDGSNVALYLRAGARVDVAAAELPSYSVREPITASWLIGQTLESAGRVRSVYRRLDFLESQVLRTDAGSEVYLPWVEGGGEQVCLAIDAGAGRALRSP